MRWDQKIQYATLSDIGLRRKNNQDSYTIQLATDPETWGKYGHLFIVADGMGGHAVGELASKMAVDEIPLTFFKSRAESIGAALTEAIEHANHAIYTRGTANIDFNRMGTTCVCFSLSAGGITLGHVGDSRAYRVRNDRIEQMTFDHSLQWELERQGRAKRNDASLADVKHVITRSLGPEPIVDVEIDGPFPVLAFDRYLLCSDGLTGYVTDSEIGMVINDLPPNEAVKLLINLANIRGGSDNTTVIVVQCGELEASDATDAPENDSPTRVVNPRSRARSVVLGLAALSVLIGVACLARQMFELGGALIAVGLLVAIGAMIRPKQVHPTEGISEGDATVDHHPYRMASARLTKEFIATLAQIELELRQMANAENWQIDWEKHAKSVAAARQAIERKKASPVALSELGKAIDLLMTGLHAHRKRLRSQATQSTEESGAG